MRTFLKTTGGRRIATRALAATRARLRRSGRTGEDGFLLIEVMISSLLVALIVTATFNGFDVASRFSTDQRRHSQAAVLAAQSQEQLRSDPASALEALELAPHTYTQTANGTTYTITESAKYINASTGGTTCTSATSSEAGKTSGSYLKIISAVTWSSLRSGRPPVEQSSIITPPTGSALQVSVLTGATPAEGVSGATVSAEYTGIESTSPTTVTATTGSTGCVIFGAIPATTAKVTVTPPLGFVSRAGALSQSETVTLAPNLTEHREFVFNRGGAIEAEFLYGSTPVSSESFVAWNNGQMEVAPEFILGDTRFSYESGGKELYTPLAGTSTTATAATTATTPIHAPGYPTGDLYPFGSGHVYQVYAGDCTKNNPTETANPEKLEPAKVIVEPGLTAKAQLQLANDTLNVYTGTASANGSLTTEALPVRITTECKTATANNAAKPLYVHEQKLSGSGHLLYPYQPFGTISVCVYSASKNKNYTVSFVNEKKSPTAKKVLLGEGSTSEQTVESFPSSPC